MKLKKDMTGILIMAKFPFSSQLEIF